MNEEIESWVNDFEKSTADVLASKKGISIGGMLLWIILLLLFSLIPLPITKNPPTSIMIVCLPITVILIYVNVLRPQNLLRRIQSLLKEIKTPPETLFELNQLKYPECFLTDNKIFPVGIEPMLASIALLVFGLGFQFLEKDIVSGSMQITIILLALPIASILAIYWMLRPFENRAKRRLAAFKKTQPMRLFLRLKCTSTCQIKSLPKPDGGDLQVIKELLRKGYPADYFFNKQLKIKAMDMLGEIKSEEALAVVRGAFFNESEEIRHRAYDILTQTSTPPENDLQLLDFLISKKDWTLIKKIDRWSLEQLLSAFEQGTEKEKNQIVALLHISDENHLIDLASAEQGPLQGPALGMLLKKWSQTADIQKITERLVRNGQEDAAERLLMRTFDHIADKSSMASLIAQFHNKRRKDVVKATEGKMAGVLIFDSDSEGIEASQFYHNLLSFIAQQKPSFPLTIHCSVGAVEDGARADGWVWSIFEDQNEPEFDGFFSQFQNSDFCKPWGEYWNANAERMGLYKKAISSGRMRILNETTIDAS